MIVSCEYFLIERSDHRWWGADFNDLAEPVPQEHQGSCLPRSIQAAAERNAHISCGQSRCVVDTVPHHSHHGPPPLEPFHHLYFAFRSDTTDGIRPLHTPTCALSPSSHELVGKEQQFSTRQF